MRLDNYLVASIGVESRTKAQNRIKEGYVSVNGMIVTKSSHPIDPERDEVMMEVVREYVSRAAWKLVHFLEEIDVEIKNVDALDIGSSTGGFCEVLLEKGAKSVVALDVGKEQLHNKLKNDPRIISKEETDVREFLHDPFDLVVSDVSFISLVKIIDDIDRLSARDIILLFKPQFEVGIGVKRDKRGVVKDQKAIRKVMNVFEDACTLKGWKLQKKSPSAITGKDGNLEYCYYFVK